MTECANPFSLCWVCQPISKSVLEKFCAGCANPFQSQRENLRRRVSSFVEAHFTLCWVCQPFSPLLTREERSTIGTRIRVGCEHFGQHTQHSKKVLTDFRKGQHTWHTPLSRSGCVSPPAPSIPEEGIASPRLPMSALAEGGAIAHVPRVTLTPDQYALTAEVQA
jgi:hypothetical protein